MSLALYTDKPRTILADVPFAFSNQATRAAASKHYNLMTIDQLKRFTFPHDETKSLLLFWAWNAAMPECIEIVKAWGFAYKTLVTWMKPHMGLGNYTRNATEHIIIAIKGSVKPKRHDILSWFMAEPREHSRKPEHQYDLAEMLGEPPYLELFARRTRNGWLSHGAELNAVYDMDLALRERWLGGKHG